MRKEREEWEKKRMNKKDRKVRKGKEVTNM